jgi:hypothetical protein
MDGRAWQKLYRSWQISVRLPCSFSVRFMLAVTLIIIKA